MVFIGKFGSLDNLLKESNRSPDLEEMDFVKRISVPDPVEVTMGVRCMRVGISSETRKIAGS